jgi:hypothetical protein
MIFWRFLALCLQLDGHRTNRQRFDYLLHHRLKERTYIFHSYSCLILHSFVLRFVIRLLPSVFGLKPLILDLFGLGCWPGLRLLLNVLLGSDQIILFMLIF